MSRKTTNLVIIDDDGFGARALNLSQTSLRLVGALFAFFLIFSTVMTWGFLYYRAKSSKGESSTVAQLEQEKAQLVAKIGALEGNLKRIEKFTEKLEASIGVESGKLNKGVGPITEQENLGEFLNRVNNLPKLSSRSLARDWRAGKFDEAFYEKMGLKLDELAEFAINLEDRVNEVYEANEDRISFWASTPSLWPTQGWITSGFGYRLSPWGEGVRMHKGIDIASPYGSAVFAPSDGTVVYSGYKGGYGNTVIIDHGYGISTLYGHNSELFVAEGDKITRGMKISAVGNTGASTGPHLHYEVHVDGIPTDPSKYIFE
ncbi:MAG TPA: M23 family metallopeptidase [bacterium]|nr:M23 family metallopeptidase [bacterium]